MLDYKQHLIIFVLRALCFTGNNKILVPLVYNKIKFTLKKLQGVGGVVIGDAKFVSSNDV